jgi:hypothetical protein
MAQAVRPAPARSDLNLEEVGKGRKPASNLLPFETLAEVDFYSFRKPDLTQWASQATSLSRGAGSQYHLGGANPARRRNAAQQFLL